MVIMMMTGPHGKTGNGERRAGGEQGHVRDDARPGNEAHMAGSARPPAKNR